MVKFAAGLILGLGLGILLVESYPQLLGEWLAWLAFELLQELQLGIAQIIEPVGVGKFEAELRNGLTNLDPHHDRFVSNPALEIDQVQMFWNEFVLLEADLGAGRRYVVDQALKGELAIIAIGNFAAEKDLLAPRPALVFDKRRKRFQRVLM